jgi:hypothetical protein
MLRLALSLISSLQVGARIKESVERSIRQAIVVAVAIVLFLFAAGFGLVAAYLALIAEGFTPIAAAGIVAGVLALLGVLVLATVPLFGKPRRREPRLVAAPAEGMAMIDQSVGKAMQQVGPLTLLVIAFAAGLLASRRR